MKTYAYFNIKKDLYPFMFRQENSIERQKILKKMALKSKNSFSQTYPLPISLADDIKILLKWVEIKF